MQSADTASLIAACMEETLELSDFDAVVRLYWPRVFRFAHASLRDRQAAEALAQDCFLKAWRGREQFRGESSLQTWLMQIAVNLVRDAARNRKLQFWKRAQAGSDEEHTALNWIPAQEADPERSVLIKEKVDAVWRATVHLSERQRTVFLLRFVEDMELLEIAAATGLNEGAVKVHLFRALRAVRARTGSLR